MHRERYGCCVMHSYMVLEHLVLIARDSRPGGGLITYHVLPSSNIPFFRPCLNHQIRGAYGTSGPAHRLSRDRGTHVILYGMPPGRVTESGGALAFRGSIHNRAGVSAAGSPRDLNRRFAHRKAATCPTYDTSAILTKQPLPLCPRHTGAYAGRVLRSRSKLIGMVAFLPGW